jgi:hypothetical protein
VTTTPLDPARSAPAPAALPDLLDGPRRDTRIDVLRGLAVVFVVVNHVDVPSLFHLLSQEAIGPISGAEMFVALSGVVVGMAYRSRALRSVRGEALEPLWRRARLLYVVTLAVVALAWLVQFVPGLNGRVLTTWDEVNADGTVTSWDLYAGIADGTTWPIPGAVLGEFLTLQLGPPQFNVMGLYVVLLLVAPVVLAYLKRGRTAAVLAVSLALYVVYQVSGTTVLTAVYESPFPLLAWQVLFVLGLAAGWHREFLVSRARTAAGGAVLGVSAVFFVVGLFLTWNNPWRPWSDESLRFSLGIIPEDAFAALYSAAFERSPLAPGRLAFVVVALITLYAALTVLRRPVERFVAPVLAPFGRATLYVFVLQVFLVALVASLPLPESGSVLWGTLIHATLLTGLWFMVRHRVLFRFIPR